MWDYLADLFAFLRLISACSLRTYTNKAKPLTYWSGDKPLSLISLMNLLISSLMILKIKVYLQTNSVRNTIKNFMWDYLADLFAFLRLISA